MIVSDVRQNDVVASGGYGDDRRSTGWMRRNALGAFCAFVARGAAIADRRRQYARSAPRAARHGDR
jgi:hypothetical protein